MKRNCFVPRVVKSVPCFSSREYIGTENVNVDGRVVTHSKIMVDDPCHRYDGISASDFCLENMLAVGMDLKEMKMDSSPWVVMSNVSRVLSNSQKPNNNESSNA